jgi:hypothetical protein
MSKWNLKLDDNLVDLEGRTLEPETIIIVTGQSDINKMKLIGVVMVRKNRNIYS